MIDMSAFDVYPGQRTGGAETVGIVQAIPPVDQDPSGILGWSIMYIIVISLFSDLPDAIEIGVREWQLMYSKLPLRALR